MFYFIGSLKLAHPLDYEVFRRLSVSIVATDSGTPPLSARCAVEIEVLDINDNAPRFSQADYKVLVGENASIGTKIIQVSFHQIMGILERIEVLNFKLLRSY